MVTQEGVFKWHIGCCPCMGPSGCVYIYDPLTQSISSQFTIIGAGDYTVYGNAIVVSGEVGFVYKYPAQEPEQRISVSANTYFTNDSDYAEYRIITDYVNENNYHFVEITGYGSGNFDGRLGKRSGGSDDYLQTLTKDDVYFCGFDCIDEIADPIDNSNNIYMCTGNDAVYSQFGGCGLHDLTTLHGGHYVGFMVTALGGDAWMSFTDFQMQDHTEWGDEIAQHAGVHEADCIDCGRCACSGESPSSYKVYIDGLIGTPCKSVFGGVLYPCESLGIYPTINSTCCSSFNGTYIVEEWGDEQVSMTTITRQYCTYINKIEENPCAVDIYTPAYVVLTTKVTPVVDADDRLTVECSIYDCVEQFYVGGAYEPDVYWARWTKDYGPAPSGGIPCTTLVDESLEFIGGSPEPYWPCSGDFGSCQITAL